MKTILLITAISAACCGAHAQGKINFSTFNFAPVTNMWTSSLVPAGPGWWAQLFYGPAGATEQQLITVTNAPVHLAIAGYVLNTTPYYTDPAVVPGGAFGTFQVRVWEALLGDNWETAYANWLAQPPGGRLGKSNLGIIRTADANADPPQTPASLAGTGPGEVGIRAIPISIPEPGTVALGLAGALALLWPQRRR